MMCIFILPIIYASYEQLAIFVFTPTRKLSGPYCPLYFSCGLGTAKGYITVRVTSIFFYSKKTEELLHEECIKNRSSFISCLGYCSSFRAVIALFLLSLTHPGESGGSRANLFYLVAQIRCCLTQSIKPRKHGKHIVDSKLAPDSAAERAKRAREWIYLVSSGPQNNPYAPKGNRVNEIVYTILYRMIQMLQYQQ